MSTGLNILKVDLGKLFGPYQQQARILAADQRYLLFLAGIGAGKTYTGACWAIMHMLVWNAGYRGAVLGRTEKKDAMDQLAQRVIELLDSYHSATGHNLVRKFDKQNNILYLTNGSSCVFRGFIQYDKLRGPEYAWIWCDELFFAGVDDKEVFDVVDGRVRIGRCKQVLITCSPRGVTRVIRRFGQAQLRAEQPGARPCRYFVVRATSYDNPHLDREDIAAWRENMSKRRAAQEIDAEILKPEHIVWPEIDDSHHVIDFDWRQHQDWLWVLAIDWGDTKGCVALDIRINPKTKQWVVADELVPQGSELPDGRLNMAKFRLLLKEWVNKRKRKPSSACADRAVTSENRYLKHLLGADTHVITMESHTEQRVNTGIEMLRDALDPASGPPRIVWARSLTTKLAAPETPGIWAAVRGFCWEVDQAGFPKSVVKDDQFKHACDALRYGWVGCRKDQRLHLTLPAMYGLGTDGPDGLAEAGDGNHSKQDRY